ncbi:MAG: hypothetical protein MUO40_01610, partial [Anaerolineaceae bacterium]|nr:hypothetical protein [Anaerolineaceae bacterium]
MNIKPDTQIARPKILTAFSSGFNTASNHIYLIVLPIIFDLILWFGPRFSIGKIFTSYVDDFINFANSESPELSNMLQDNYSLLVSTLNNFNLLSMLRTYPVGVTSLLSPLSPTSNPIGIPIGFDLTSMGSIISTLIVILLIGIIFGSLFFHQISNSVYKQLSKNKFADFSKAAGQIIILPIILAILLIMILIPIAIIIPILNIISPAIGQIGLMIALVAVVWLLIPLFFTPHSIFLYKQNIITSMMTSISVVRFTLPGSAFFLFTAFLMSEGMNLLWT